MDDVRTGRVLRALRRRRNWPQHELARRCGLAQTTISLVERGHLDRLSLRTVRRVFATFDASFDPLVRWRGGEVDRLLDARHAAVVGRTVARLSRLNWQVMVEVTFNHFGERGSIDVLAQDARTGVVLVVEAKSELASIEETIRRLDAKARLAVDIADDRFGRRPTRIGVLLVVAASTANRSRVRRADAVLRSAFPHRGRSVGSWLRRPSGPLRGIVFIPV